MDHCTVPAGADPRDREQAASSCDYAQAGFQTDRDQVVLEHLPLVQRIAKRVYARVREQVDLRDLVSAGTLGLLDAYDKYDPTRRVPFPAYASFRIRGAIIDNLRLLDWGPRSLRRKARDIEETISNLSGQLRRAPSEAEIANAMRMSLQEYQQLLGALKGLEIGSLHTETFDDREEELAYVPDPAEKGPLFRCLESEMRQRLASAIEALPERDRLVVTLYYYEEMTQQEIALVLNVSSSRISQMLTCAVLRLRSSLADPTRFDS